MAADLHTTLELADTFRVQPLTVRKWTKDGIIHPSLRLPSGRPLFDLNRVIADLADYHKSRAAHGGGNGDE